MLKIADADMEPIMQRSVSREALLLFSENRSIMVKKFKGEYDDS